MKLTTVVFFLLLSAASFAQTMNCSHISGAAPWSQNCSYNNPGYSSMVYSTGIFSPAGSGQVPRIPRSLSVSLNWDTSSIFGAFYVVNIYTPNNVLFRQYSMPFGMFQGAGNTTNPQIMVLDVSADQWPSEFKIELVQYVSMTGTTNCQWRIELTS